MGSSFLETCRPTDSSYGIEGAGGFVVAVEWESVLAVILLLLVVEAERSAEVDELVAGGEAMPTGWLSNE